VGGRGEVVGGFGGVRGRGRGEWEGGIMNGEEDGS